MLRLELHGPGDVASLAAEFPTVPTRQLAKAEQTLTAAAWF